MWEDIEIKLKADISNFDQWMREAEKIARDTWVKLDPLLKRELSLKVDDFDQKIKKAKTLLKDLDKDSDEARELRLDINSYKRNLTEAKRRLNNYVNTWEVWTSRLQAKFDQVTDEIKKSRDELIKLWKSTKWLDKIENNIEQVNKAFRDWKIDIWTYTKEIWDLQKELKQTWWWLDKISSKLEWFSTSMIWIIWAWLTTDLFLWVDDALTKLKASTNATKDEAVELEKSFSDLSKKGFIDMDSNVKVLSVLKKEMWLVWDEATHTAEQILWIATVFDKDVNETMRASIWLMRNFWIEWSEANDLITAALQNSWDLYDDILDTLNEYSTQFSLAWYSAEEFTNILVNGSKDWAYMIDKVWDAVKEATVSLLDNSKTTKTAFSKMWLDYNSFLSELNKWDITVKDWIAIINEKLLWLDRWLRDEVWTAIYKTKWEDLNESVLQWLTSWKNALWDFQGSADLTSKQLQKWLSFQINKLKWLLIDLAWKIMPWVIIVSNAVRNAFQMIANAAANVWLWIQQWFLLWSAVIKDFFAFASTIARAWWTIFSDFWENAWIAVWNISVYARKWLNNFLKLINKIVNKAVNIINFLPWIKIPPVTFTWINPWEIKKLKEFRDITKYIKYDTANWSKAKAISKELWKIQDENSKDMIKNVKWIWNEEITTWNAAKKQILKDEKKLNKEKLDYLKKLLKAKEDAEKDADDKKSKSKLKSLNEEIEKSYKSLKSTAQKTYKWIDSDLDKSSKKHKKYRWELEKNKDAFKDFRKSAKQDIAEINKELAKLWKKEVDVISESEWKKKEFLVKRIVTIDKELNNSDLDNLDIKKLEKEKEDAKKSLLDIVKNEFNKNWNFKNKSQLQIEIDKIIEVEKKYNELSETKRRLLDIDNEKIKKLKEISDEEERLKEKKNISNIFAWDWNISFERWNNWEILKAFYKSEKDWLIEITNEKNIQYAIQLADKRFHLREEKTELKNRIDYEARLYDNLLKWKINLEREWIKIFKESINSQVSDTKRLNSEMLKLANIRLNAWYVWGLNFTKSVNTSNNQNLSSNNIKNDVSVTVIDKTTSWIRLDEIQHRT